jgi:hypothetical protein
VLSSCDQCRPGKHSADLFVWNLDNLSRRDSQAVMTLRWRDCQVVFTLYIQNTRNDCEIGVLCCLGSGLSTLLMVACWRCLSDGITPQQWLVARKRASPKSRVKINFRNTTFFSAPKHEYFLSEEFLSVNSLSPTELQKRNNKF